MCLLVGFCIGFVRFKEFFLFQLICFYSPWIGSGAVLEVGDPADTWKSEELDKELAMFFRPRRFTEISR